MSRLALVVCTYRRPRPLVRLLEAIADQERRPDDVVVVDGSTDTETEQAVRASAPEVRYCRVEAEDRGLTRQRNVGIGMTTDADLVAFLDDDTVPEPDYFAHVLACFERHPDAVGVGGYLTGTTWRRVPADAPKADLGTYRFGPWERRDDLRWRLRRVLGLAGGRPPGTMPPSGHGRSLGYLPPDGADHAVEFVMGGAATWRRTLLDEVAFSPDFDGYGLYEDLDFSIRAGRHGGLVLCAAARLAHLHEPAGRPRAVRYGRMVTVNGWRVWRTRWPSPPRADRLRWWMISLLLTACRFGDAVRGPGRRQAVAEGVGRLLGMAEVVTRPTRGGSHG